MLTEYDNTISQFHALTREEELRKGDRKKKEIIEAAIDCLASEGIENTTFEAIAQRIDTRRAHVAYHYKDKNMIFEAAVNYILATYAHTLQSYLELAEEKNKDPLEYYIRGAFDWAKSNPSHVSVFLLFYYLSTFQRHYLELNSRIRRDGKERILYLLTVKMDLEMNKTELKNLSNIIQSILSAKMVELFTTNYLTNKNAQDETIKMIRRLI